MSDEVAGVGGSVGRDVERFDGAHSRHGAAGDVAHRVATGLARAEADVADQAHDRRGILQLDVVKLEVLAGGHVALAQWSVLVGKHTERVELVRGQTAERCLDPHHVHVGLPLAVDPLAQSETLELGRVVLPGLELLDLLLEVVDLLGKDLDDALSAGLPLGLCHYPILSLPATGSSRSAIKNEPHSI